MQGFMRMALVVILEPSRQLGQDRLSITTIVNIHVISLEGFDEGLCHPIRLRAAHRREARHQAQAIRKGDRLVGSIATAIVREPLDRMRQSSIAKSSFDAWSKNTMRTDESIPTRTLPGHPPLCHSGFQQKMVELCTLPHRDPDSDMCIIG